MGEKAFTALADCRASARTPRVNTTAELTLAKMSTRGSALTVDSGLRKSERSVIYGRSARARTVSSDNSNEVEAELETASLRMPDGWEEYNDDAGSAYYYDTINGTTQWERPRCAGGDRSRLRKGDSQPKVSFDVTRLPRERGDGSSSSSIAPAEASGGSGGGDGSPDRRGGRRTISGGSSRRGSIVRFADKIGLPRLGLSTPPPLPVYPAEAELSPNVHMSPRIGVSVVDASSGKTEDSEDSAGISPRIATSPFASGRKSPATRWSARDGAKSSESTSASNRNSVRFANLPPPNAAKVSFDDTVDGASWTAMFGQQRRPSPDGAVPAYMQHVINAKQKQRTHTSGTDGAAGWGGRRCCRGRGAALGCCCVGLLLLLGGGFVAVDSLAAYGALPMPGLVPWPWLDAAPAEPAAPPSMPLPAVPPYPPGFAPLPPPSTPPHPPTPPPQPPAPPAPPPLTPSPHPPPPHLPSPHPPGAAPSPSPPSPPPSPAAPPSVVFWLDLRDDVTPNLADGEVPWVVGATHLDGPVGHAMTAAGGTKWRLQIELPLGVDVTYKFRLGYSATWDGADFEADQGLVEGGCTSGAYNDRVVVPTAGMYTEGPFCFGACTACPEPPPRSPPPPPPPPPPSTPPAPKPPPPSPPSPPMAVSQPCEVAEGETVHAGGAWTCDALRVSGTLHIESPAHLTAASIYVAGTGALHVGSEARPATQVTIELSHSDCAPLETSEPNAWSDCLSDGTLVSVGEVHIHGAPKTSWTQLNADCAAGCASLSVDECDGWSVGERIVVAATGGEAESYAQLINVAASGDPQDNYKAEERTIASISHAGGGREGCTVGVDSPLLYRHRGEYLHGVVPTRAEVANLARSVTITGPPVHWVDAAAPIYGGQGLTTVQVGGGVMVVEWARVENCGRVALGEYCLHWHLVGDCPDCAFRGNVVEGGVNKGITLHGTHNATVDDNVVYDVRGASIYVEDGNEVGNTLSNNCLICPSLSNAAQIGRLSNAFTGVTGTGHRCGLYGVAEHADSDQNEQSGIYVLSATSHLIGNHVSGHDNAFFANHQGGRSYGIGAAAGRTCVASSPFLTTRGNVFHNNAGFGWYVNVAFPTHVETDHQGYVTNWESCLPFDMDTGADLAAPTLVADHVEYFNDFAMGAYDLGDVTFANTTSALNNKGMYFKTYRRGPQSGPLCDRCTFHDNQQQIEGPGGAAAVEFAATTFSVRNVGQHVQVNHHCGFHNELTGGLCASHYLFDTASFTGGEPNFWASDDAGDTIVFYGGGVRYMTSTAHPAFDATGSGCTADGVWTVCPFADARIVRIYSPNRGALAVAVSGEGSYSVPYRAIPKWEGSSKYAYTPGCNSGDAPTDCVNYIWPSGYTFIVRAGASLTLTPSTALAATALNPKHDLFALEYSEGQLPVTSIEVSVTGEPLLNGGPCSISSQHNRDFVTPYGPLVAAAGAWWHCVGGWATVSSTEEFRAAFQSSVVQNTHADCGSAGDELNCAEIYMPVAGGSVVYDPACDHASNGCNAGGHVCCRTCDAEGYMTCADNDVPFDPTGGV